ESDILWYYWGVLGLVLMIGEILLPSFFLLFVAIGCLVVSLAVYIFEPSNVFQISLFSLSLALTTFIWFKFVKSKIGDKNYSVESEESYFGRIVELHGEGKGLVRFVTSYNGQDVWKFTSEDTDLEVGMSVKVLSVVDNEIKVEKGE
ncbi:hypothetical protein A3715_19305, partial [Oleiphilus sp. HI0009]